MRAGDADAEQPDGTCAGNKHIAAGERHDGRGMHGVATGIEHGRMPVGNVIMHGPDIERRNHDTLGECARAVNSDDRCFAAEMATTCAAKPAMPAGDMALAADALAGRKMIDAFAGAHDAADEFMAHHARRLHPARRPIVPFPDVKIRPAHPRHIDGDFDLSGSRSRWSLHIGVGKPFLGASFENGEHGHPFRFRAAKLSAIVVRCNQDIGHVRVRSKHCRSRCAASQGTQALARGARAAGWHIALHAA